MDEMEMGALCKCKELYCTRFEKIHNKKRRKIILIRPDIFSIEVIAFDEEQNCKS